jgi:hypothetical protein
LINHIDVDASYPSNPWPEGTVLVVDGAYPGEPEEQSCGEASQQPIPVVFVGMVVGTAEALEIVERLVIGNLDLGDERDSAQQRSPSVFPIGKPLS